MIACNDWMSLYCEQEREVINNKYNEKINKIILKIKLNQSEYSSGSNLSHVLMQYKHAAIQLPHAVQTLENAHI